MISVGQRMAGIIPYRNRITLSWTPDNSSPQYMTLVNDSFPNGLQGFPQEGAYDYPLAPNSGTIKSYLASSAYWWGTTVLKKGFLYDITVNPNSTNSTGVLTMGIGDGVLNAGANNNFVSFGTSVSGTTWTQWIGYAQAGNLSGGTSQTFPTGIIPVNGISNRLQIRCNSAGNLVTWYIDGNSVATDSTTTDYLNMIATGFPIWFFWQSSSLAAQTVSIIGSITVTSSS